MKTDERAKKKGFRHSTFQQGREALEEVSSLDHSMNIGVFDSTRVRAFLPAQRREEEHGTYFMHFFLTMIGHFGKLRELR